ncbi:choline-glycine betaine transporter [Geomicrobium halophilum]|uniref:Choline-glycine betaine transporter n=1 Tax=Geomicrobium halophilum TaxID=549000 RepID=A0A841PZQ7_9BACL|nr:BCCT family transporter [Geomicrobium halophilum]MBB6450302.1 choline-glycine betaine transporter [Geomicrobium halophilum]
MKNKTRLDNRIFTPSLLIIITISILFAIYTDESMELLDSIFNTIVEMFKWGYIWYAVLIVGAGLYLSFSKYGDVVLGDPTEKPRFTLFEYASILIAMGVGATIMRTGVVQWSQAAIDPPFGLEAGSMEAILAGNSYSMFLWSFQTFAVFVMVAPAIGYILHVRKKPKMRISEACRVIFGDKFTDGLGGIVLDTIFMVSILAGAAVTLGLGTPIVTYNLAELLNIEVTFTFTMIVTLIWVTIFTVSAYVGIEKGIKKLSTLNMYLAGLLALFVIFVGPGVFILDFFTDSVRYLGSNYLDFSLYTHSMDLEGGTHIESHTVFWFAYNATWAMLHGVFAAVVSKGRTIKEMILTYLLAPTLLAWFATGLLGGLGVHRYLTGDVPVLDIVQEEGPESVVPAVLTSMPFSTVVLIVFVIIATIFLATTLDSTTYTIASYTTNRDMSKQAPPKNVRIIIAALITILALSLMNIGGLAPLEVLSGLMGIPIIILQILTVIAAKKMMDEDQAWIHNVRKNK